MHCLNTICNGIFIRVCWMRFQNGGLLPLPSLCNLSKESSSKKAAFCCIQVLFLHVKEPVKENRADPYSPLAYKEYLASTHF